MAGSWEVEKTVLIIFFGSNIKLYFFLKYFLIFYLREKKKNYMNFSIERKLLVDIDLNHQKM